MPDAAFLLCSKPKHAFFACRMPDSAYRIRSPKQCSLLPGVITMHFAKLTFFVSRIRFLDATSGLCLPAIL
jgi:hypothetical protein